MSITFEELMTKGSNMSCNDHSAHVWEHHMYNRQIAISICSDMGKDACGVRPRWLHWDSMTNEEIRQQTDQFADQVEQERWDREEDAKAVSSMAAKRLEECAFRPNNEMALKLTKALRNLS